MRRTSPLASRLASAAAAFSAAVVLAGCASLSSAISSAAASATASGTAPASAAAAQSTGTGTGTGLAKIHDPKQVTYSITLTTCHFRDGGQLPDPKCTPGAIDPAVTQANIQSTICKSGYTATVRPSAAQTDKAKYQVAYVAYGVPHSAGSELDHLVSLEIGGANDIANLWPEVGKVPNPKDPVENALHKAVCNGTVTLAAAQEAIASDWQTAEAKLGIK
jgi:hypothetical protein